MSEAAMNKKTNKVSGGFTLVELMITIAVMSIIVSAVGIVIIDGQRCWRVLHGRINSEVATDGYVARKKFDAIMRKASGEKILTDSNGNWIEVYYFSSDSSTAVDRYARFYEADGNLNMEYGELNPRKTLGTETVCRNVSDCTFKQAGRSAQMLLTLDDGTQKNTIVTSAVTHN
jgi:prepilin-type N-terminal cleavage/methylation domain-containing protein